jgi:hypothetical protein
MMSTKAFFSEKHIEQCGEPNHLGRLTMFNQLQSFRNMWRYLFLFLSISILSGCHAESATVSPSTTAKLSLDGPQLELVLPRYGLNLGGSGTWGAEQLRANVLLNPGFEPVLDRTILILKETDSNRIVDDSNWLARPDGFWSSASFNVRSGLSAGQSGRVIDSRKRPQDGLGEFWLDTANLSLNAGDVVVVTQQNKLETAPQWWLGKGRIANAPNQGRPSSPGKQAVRLMALPGQPAEILHYLDNIPARAGKLLPIHGKWRFSIWAKAASPGAQLHIHFDRGGSVVFLDTNISPKADWKLYSFEFEGKDNGPPAPLTLSIVAREGEIMLDDAYLGEANVGTNGFRQVVVDTLKALKPGYLRDWQGQLGDTLDNRLTESQGHQPVRYRPGEHELQFHYSLPDFLALCATVGAQPWVVAPTTLNDEEWQRFGAWLHQAINQYGFSEIMVEFGNENWNQTFRPGGIPNTATHAVVADRAFRLLKMGSQQDNRIHTVVGAQFVNTENPRLLGEASHEADRISVAPYFMYRLEAGTPLATAYQMAFSDNDDVLMKEAANAKKTNQRLAVYEENFHTTLGNADAGLRNAVVTGAISGPALARRLLQGTLAGVREQAVYSFSGFDSYLQEGQGLVHLWGITRDLASVGRFRPTGIALELLNRVSGGTANAVRCVGEPCPDLTAVAFQQGKHLAVVSSSAQAQDISVSLPCPNGKLNIELLNGSQPELNNENSEQVTSSNIPISCIGNQVNFSLPAHSLAVFYP